MTISGAPFLSICFLLFPSVPSIFSDRAWYDRLILAVRLALPSTCPYKPILSESLVGLFSIIFVKVSQLHRCRDMEVSTVKTGMKGRYGNKGAIVARVVVDDTRWVLRRSRKRKRPAIWQLRDSFFLHRFQLLFHQLSLGCRSKTCQAEERRCCWYLGSIAFRRSAQWPFGLYRWRRRIDDLRSHQSLLVWRSEL